MTDDTSTQGFSTEKNSRTLKEESRPLASGIPIGSSPPSEGSRIFDPKIIKKLIKEELQVKINQLQARNIEILGVFVALFTFISIEFQLARNFDFNFILFSVFFAGLLIFFVLTLHIILHKEINCLIFLFALLALVTILYTSNKLSPRETIGSQQRKTSISIK